MFDDAIDAILTDFAALLETRVATAFGLRKIRFGTRCSPQCCATVWSHTR